MGMPQSSYISTTNYFLVNTMWYSILVYIHTCDITEHYAGIMGEWGNGGVEANSNSSNSS